MCIMFIVSPHAWHSKNNTYNLERITFPNETVPVLYISFLPALSNKCWLFRFLTLPPGFVPRVSVNFVSWLALPQLRNCWFVSTIQGSLAVTSVLAGWLSLVLACTFWFICPQANFTLVSGIGLLVHDFTLQLLTVFDAFS